MTTRANSLTADYDYQTDETYSYDANGNRTNTGYTTGDANRLPHRRHVHLPL